MEVQPQHAAQAAAAEILHPVINPVTYWIIPQYAKNILSERYDFIKDSEQTPQLNGESFSQVIYCESSIFLSIRPNLISKQIYNVPKKLNILKGKQEIDLYNIFFIQPHLK